MKKILLVLWILCSLTTIDIRAADSVDFFPLEQIKPGLKGYGLSCFKGTTPIRLDVEILGLVGGEHPDTVKILAKVSGPAVDKGGIMSGMSGSPVYIDGKLVGAMAFAFPYAKEAICGITPIHQMNQLWTTTSAGISFPGNPAARIKKLLTGAGDRAQNDMIPIFTPLVYSGADPVFLDKNKMFFSRINMIPISSPAIDTTAEPPPELIPGGVIGISLVKGDIQMAGMGTITWTDGKRALGFGHPMFHAGKCRLPMVSGTVVSYLPSIAQSFKFMNSGDVIGTIVADGSAGIAGITGISPWMIPVTLTITQDSGKKKSYQLKIFENRFFTTLFCASALGSLISANAPTSDDHSYDLDIRIDISNHKPVYRHYCAGDAGSPMTELMDALEPMNTLMNNHLADVTIEHVYIDCVISEKQNKADLISVTVSPRRVHPGENLIVTLKYKQFRHSMDIKHIQLDLPKTIRPGTYQIAVLDTDGYRDWFQAGHFSENMYLSIDSLIDDLNKNISNNALHVLVMSPRKNFVGEGVTLEKLPPSAAFLLSESGPDTKIRDVYSAVVEKTIFFKHQIIGTAQCELNIEPLYDE